MKKYYSIDLKLSSIIAAIMFAVASFFLIFNQTNPIFLGLFGALFLAVIHGGLNGVALGGGVSALSILASIWYKVNYGALKVTKAMKKDAALYAAKEAEYNAFISHIKSYMILYILGAIALAFVGRYIYLKLTEDDRDVTHFSAKSLTYGAMFVALGVAINTLRVGYFSFGGFPIIYSGMVMGPINGFIIGAITDLLAFLVRPSANAFNPLFVLTSALTGFIPALIVKLAPGEDKAKHQNAFLVLFAIAVGQIVTSVLLVPLFMTILYMPQGESFWAYFFLKFGNAALKQLTHVPLYAFLYLNTQRVVSRQFNFNHKKQAD